MRRPYDELWGEPVRAEDVLDGREQREYRAEQAARSRRATFRVEGERLFVSPRAEVVDAEGFEW